MSFEITLIANPENRRATMFRDAVHTRGGTVREMSWLDVMAGARPEEGVLVRIDSFGENSEVASWMLDKECCDLGRIEGLEQTYMQWAELLSTFPRARYMTAPDDILAMFDKIESKRRMEQAGLRVPRSFGLIRTYEELRAVLERAETARAFIKPRHGSSASGVIALTMDDSRVSAKTSVELDDDSIYNCLRVQHYTTHRSLAKVVNLLGKEDELLVEEWVPKASTEGGVFDVRVVVIDGCAEHAVVRVSKSPMTNLHLGCSRGCVDAVRAQVGSAWERVLKSASTALAAFPTALYAGVDVGITPSYQRVTPFEINAFGDLLPGVLDRSGRDTYTAEVDAFLRREGVRELLAG